MQMQLPIVVRNRFESLHGPKLPSNRGTQAAAAPRSSNTDVDKTRLKGIYTSAKQTKTPYKQDHKPCSIAGVMQCVCELRVRGLQNRKTSQIITQMWFKLLISE